jgi:hypothetical protein
LAMLGWALRTIYNKLATQLTNQDVALGKLTVTSSRLEVGVFGYDGTNGINGAVKELKLKVDELVRGRS